MITIDPDARELWRSGELAVLAPHVFDCIAYLLANRERAVGRDELIAAVWGRADVNDATLHQALMKARRALGDSGEEQRTIRTVPRFGYRWIAPVEALAAPASTPPAPDGVPAPDRAAPSNPAASAAPATATSEAGAPAPRAAARPPATRRMLLLAMSALVVVLALAFVAWRGRAPVPAPVPADAREPALVVLPVTVAAGGDTAWIPLGVMDAIASYLRDGGEVVVPSQSVISVLGDAGGAEPTLQRWREATGATRLLRAQASRHGNAWRITLALHGQGAEQVHASGDAAEVIEAAQVATRRLLASLHPDAAAPHLRVADDTALLLQRVRAELLANRLEVAASVLDRAGDAAQAAPEVRLMRAEVDYRAGRFDAARAACARLLDELAAESQPLLRAQALVMRASIDRTAAHFEQAEAGYAQAIALLAPLDDAIALGRAHLARGASLGSLRRFDEARSEVALGRVLLGGAGDAQGVAAADAAMANLDADRGRLADASTRLARAIDQLERLGEHAAALDQRIALAQMRTELFDHKAALDTSEGIWREVGDQAGHRLYLMAGSVHARALAAVGRLDEAARVLTRVEGMPSGQDYQWRYSRTVAAQLALERGDVDRAGRIAAEVANRPGMERHSELGPLLLAWTRALRAQGKADALAAARERIAPWLEQAESGHAEEVVYASLIRAELARFDGRAEDGESEYRAALARASGFGVPMHVVAVAWSYGNALVADGRLDRAAAVVGQVASLVPTDFGCALLAARLHRALGNRDAWREAIEQVRALAGERRIPPAIAEFEPLQPAID